MQIVDTVQSPVNYWRERRKPVGAALYGDRDRPGARDMRCGEAFVGESPNNAHVNVLLGPSDGPVGAAFAGALCSPSLGHVPFLTVLAPNVAVRPPTLFVNKVDIRGERHARLTWGAAQAGVARGVLGAVQDGLLPDAAIDGWLIVAAVWVNPEASDEAAVFETNRIATAEAIRRAITGEPGLAAQAAAAESPWNPFFGRRHGPSE